MAKLVITVDVSDEFFNRVDYPEGRNETVIDMIEYDIEQVHLGNISESELLDIYLESKGGIVELEAE